MSRVNYGTVEVCVGDTTYTLKPTIKAIEKIERRWPTRGLFEAVDACGLMKKDDLAYVIAAGAGIGQRESTDLHEAVFFEGVSVVAPPVIKYLVLLMNPSGKELDGEEAEDEEAPEGE